MQLLQFRRPFLDNPLLSSLVAPFKMTSFLNFPSPVKQTPHPLPRVKGSRCDRHIDKDLAWVLPQSHRMHDKCCYRMVQKEC